MEFVDPGLDRRGFVHVGHGDLDGGAVFGVAIADRDGEVIDVVAVRIGGGLEVRRVDEADFAGGLVDGEVRRVVAREREGERFVVDVGGRGGGHGGGVFVDGGAGDRQDRRVVAAFDGDGDGGGVRGAVAIAHGVGERGRGRFAVVEAVEETVGRVGDRAVVIERGGADKAGGVDGRDGKRITVEVEIVVGDTGDRGAVLVGGGRVVAGQHGVVAAVEEGEIVVGGEIDLFDAVQAVDILAVRDLAFDDPVLAALAVGDLVIVHAAVIDRGVEAAPAVQTVGACAPHQAVVALTAEEPVVAVAAVEHVVPVAAEEKVTSRAAEEAVVAEASEENVAPGKAAQHVVPEEAEQHVRAVASIDGVVAEDRILVFLRSFRTLP